MYPARMRFLDARGTEALLPYSALAEALRELLASKRSGAARAPTRLAVPLGGGASLLVMPAADAGVAVTKLVTVHPGNAARGLPTIQGEVVVMRAETGERLGVLDGAAVTARRTAALSLLAAKSLAPRPDGALWILGAGTQARSHLEAFREGLGTKKVFVSSRGEEKARALADHARNLGMDARVIGNVEEALGEASLVVTATTSAEPVLPEEIPADAFVAAVGSFRPEMAELPAALIRSANRVVADDLEGAREEAGDLIQAVRAGALSWENVLPLEDVLDAGRPEGPVIYESVGHALWDLAAARLAFADDLN
jgi:ornithine cyclodeaminase/alanine dehydrogenase-like protein (mu-crystallin family)